MKNLIWNVPDVDLGGMMNKEYIWSLENLKNVKKNGLKVLGGFAARFAGGRVFAILTGPIGWAATAAWTIFDFAGPAYRVMIPATIAVAYLRIISQKSEDELNNLFN